MEDKGDIFTFENLGGGQEVGRSCHIIQFKGKCVMLDAGVHPAIPGLGGLPYYDTFDMSTVDIILISHFHLDHAASLPYVIMKTDFRGRVYMTLPTKAIYRSLLSDFIKVSAIDTEDQIYDTKDLTASLDRIEAVDFHSTVEVDGIRFTPYHAGHVLGAAMYFIEIAGVKVLFTGDYSREDDRMLIPAELPPTKPDILICESTFGTASHEPRPEKEARLTNSVHKILARGGRVLMPIFALGEAQNILLILEEYWSQHPELQTIPIWYTSSLAKRCMSVYSAYTNAMNERIQRANHPFEFKYVKFLRQVDNFEDVGSCVMLATPGMLQSGGSRVLLEKWASDAKNGMILAGYSVEGTMARHLVSEPAEIVALSGQTIPRRISVEEISFAAHVDYTHNSQFIELVDANHIILVHGELHQMARLKSALMSKYSSQKDRVKIYNPRNCDELRLYFKGEKIAKVVGTLANKSPEEDQILNGVLVQKDFNMSLIAAEDLREFAGLDTNVVMQRLTVAFHGGLPLVKWHLDQMFGGVILESGDSGKKPMFKVMDAVVVVFETQNTLSINWIGNAMNDTIAEAVLTIILAAENSRASLPALDMIAPHAAVVRQDKLSRVLLFLREQFGDSITEAEDGVEIRVDNIESHMAKLDFETMEVEGKWEPLVGRVKYIVKRALGVVAPLGVGGVVEDEDLVAEMEGLVDDGIGHENGNGIGKIEDEDE